MYTNKKNGKKYVGKCHGDVKKRYNDHLSGHGSKLLKQAFDKYGIDNFFFEVLHDGILDIFLDDYEIEAIKKYNTNAKRPNGWGYNQTDGGGGTLGYKLSAETKTKISEAKTGKPLSAEARKKMSESRKGKPLSAEHRRNISQAHKGKIISPEHRKKNSVAHKGRTHTPEAKAKISTAHRGKNNYFYGKNHSAEARKKMSESHKGKVLSAEHRRKLSEAHKGRSHTPEARAKISQGNKIPLWNDKEAVAETIRLYTVELKPLEYIAEVLNVSRSTVTRVLKSNKIKIRKGQNQHTQKRRPSHNRSDAWNHQEEIIKLYTKDMLSLRKIAIRYNVRSGAISNILKSNNIKVRKRQNQYTQKR